MPGYIQAVPGTNTIYATHQATLHDSDRDSRWSPHWRYRRRGTHLSPSSGDASGRWPNRSGFYSDPASATTCCMDQDRMSSKSGDWAPRIHDDGCSAAKYIMGLTVDSGGTALGNCVVQGFETTSDAIIDETTSDENGRYEIRAKTNGVSHYLVAYKAGSPDVAGTTVNTLTPTNRDGT